ncbi:uncharacterized [Tachysurus ichikawai]
MRLMERQTAPSIQHKQKRTTFLRKVELISQTKDNAPQTAEPVTLLGSCLAVSEPYPTPGTSVPVPILEKRTAALISCMSLLHLFAARH